MFCSKPDLCNCELASQGINAIKDTRQETKSETELSLLRYGEQRNAYQARLISIQNITAVYAVKQPNTFNSPEHTPQYAAAYLGSF